MEIQNIVDNIKKFYCFVIGSDVVNNMDDEYVVGAEAMNSVPKLEDVPVDYKLEPKPREEGKVE